MIEALLLILYLTMFIVPIMLPPQAPKPTPDVATLIEPVIQPNKPPIPLDEALQYLWESLNRWIIEQAWLPFPNGMVEYKIFIYLALLSLFWGFLIKSLGDIFDYVEEFICFLIFCVLELHQHTKLFAVWFFSVLLLSWSGWTIWPEICVSISVLFIFTYYACMSQAYKSFASEIRNDWDTFMASDAKSYFDVWHYLMWIIGVAHLSEICVPFELYYLITFVWLAYLCQKVIR